MIVIGIRNAYNPIEREVMLSEGNVVHDFMVAMCRPGFRVEFYRPGDETPTHTYRYIRNDS